METMHLQTAGLTDRFIVKQWNQPAIDILQAPHQHLPALIQQMCTRNRTRMAEHERHEARDFVEIDAYATSGKTKEIKEDDLMMLNLVRTGSLWTKNTTYWTGKVDDMTCSVCNDEEETAEHIIWRCHQMRTPTSPNQAWHCTCSQGNYPGNVLGYHGRGVASGSTTTMRLR